jgi:pimeloyl-ACP methyl ester carboxylesterase
MTGSPWKLLLSGLAWSAIAYLFVCFALIIWQNRLIFLPSRTLQLTPEKLGLDYEDVWLSVLTWDGKVQQLHGWWLPNPSSAGKVLLYLHGNGGNISSNLGAARRFQQGGFSVLLIDYRGYGRSQGQFPSEAEVYRDAQAAWDYLIQRRGIAPGNIFLYGHSLGGAIAIDLAVRQPQAAGLIVENTFTSLRDMVDHRGIYQFFPIDWILHQRFDSLSKLKLLQVPLLVVRGLADRTVPPAMGERLYAVARVPKLHLVVPDADHNDVGAMAEDRYAQALQGFYQLVRQNQKSGIGKK